MFAPFKVALAPISRAEASDAVPTASLPVIETLALQEKEEVPSYLNNCYEFMKMQIPDLPATKDLKPNTTIHKGVVALFNYHGIPHYALVTAVGADTFTVVETNFKHGQKTIRQIDYTDKALLGFWGTNAG